MARVSAKEQITRRRIWTHAGIVATLLLGTWLRLTALGAESIWLDEATSILLGQMQLPALVRTTAQDIHPPVYYMLLHAWLFLGTSEFVVRALSAFVGILSIAVIYRFGTSLQSTHLGLTSALFLAISPLHVWYSQETRMYALVTLLTLAGSYWLWRGLDEIRSGKTWGLYTLLMALSLYTHYHAVFVLLAQNIFLFLWWLLSSRSKQILRPWFLSQLGVVILFLPWLPTLLRQIAQGGGYWISEAIGAPTLVDLVGTWIDYNLGLVRALYPLALRRLGYLLLLVPATYMLYRTERAIHQHPRARQSRRGLFLLLLLCGGLGAVWLVSQAKPMYARRYLLLFLPPYLLFLAGGLVLMPWQWVRRTLLVALAALYLTGVGLTTYYPQKDNWRGLVRYVKQASCPGDIVVFDPLWNYKPFNYYAQDRIEAYIELPVPIPAKAEVDQLLAPALQDHERIWLIWRPGHYADPQGRLASYLNAHFPQELKAEFPGIGQVALYNLEAES